MSNALDRDRLLERAQAVTGLTDWGDLPFVEGLDVFLWSLEHESGISPERLPSLVESTVERVLVKRLRLVNDRKIYPQIAQQEIAPPIIITGLPRSGSTHLHALMALEPSVRAPLHWEMDSPSPPPGAAQHTEDDRITSIQRDLDNRPHAKELMVSHPFGATRPEQCIGLLDWSFMNVTLMSRARIPTYYEWFLSADQKVMYEHHRRALQHFQAFQPARWMLKHPKHLFGLDALLKTYPDAKIVWTHRDPANVIPSVANFTFTYRKTFVPEAEPQRFGPEWVAMEEMGLLRGMQARERLLSESQVCDVHFSELMADPGKVVTSIYDHFGLPRAPDLTERVDNFMDANPRDKHGVNTYTPEQYGLKADRLRARFSEYIDRFGVKIEAKRS